MPELPEVETVVRLLNQQLTGATLDHIEWRVPSLLKGDISAFASLFNGQTIEHVSRRAKYILIHFLHGYTLVSHLRMEGKYREFKDDSAPISPYAHVLFYLQDGRRIEYQDVRKFGTFEWIQTNQLFHLKSLAQLGPEPFEIQDIPSFHQQLKASSRSIKALLLDQTIIAGLGNIYVDETLFASSIHPSTRGKNLTLAHTTSLLEESTRILKAAIESGGTRIRSYSSGQPIDGQFALKIKVYQQDGKPCPRCGHRLAKKVVAGRGTHFCPRCQHDPNLPYVVGITGSMASGKTTCLQVAKAKGYAVLSADDVVRTLYQKPFIQRQLKALVGPSVIQNKRVMGSLLLNWMMENPRHLRKLEAWLHPLVIETMKTWVSKQKKLAFVEIPLLFQRHADAWIDHILAIDRPFELRKVAIEARHPGDTCEMYLRLDEKNQWKTYASFVDTLIQNERTLDHFIFEIENVLTSLIKALPAR